MMHTINKNNCTFIRRSVAPTDIIFGDDSKREGWAIAEINAEGSCIYTDLNVNSL